MKYNIQLQVTNVDESTSTWVSDIHADADLTVAAVKTACVTKVRAVPTEELTEVRVEANGKSQEDTYVVKKTDRLVYKVKIKKK